MSSADGVFGEGTFDSATFNNVSRSEFSSVTDSETTVKVSKFLEQPLSLNISEEYFLSFTQTQTFSVVDKRTKDFRTSLNPFLTVSDVESLNTLKDVNESFVLNSFTDSESEFLRETSASFSISDSAEEFASLIVAENFQATDEVNTLAELYRVISNSFELNDSDLKEAGKKLDEQVFTATSTEKDFEKEIVQQTALSDKSQKALFKALSESLKISDEIDSTATFSSSQTVSVSVLDSQSSQLQKSLKEVNTLNESLLREIDLNLDEVFNPQASAEVRRLAGRVADEVEIESLQKALAKVEYLKRAYVED